VFIELATPFYLKKTGGFVRCGGSDVYAEEDGPSQQISGAELTKVSILGANGGCLLLPLEPRSIAKGSTSGRGVITASIRGSARLSLIYHIG
jgi:hypothetical protein